MVGDGVRARVAGPQQSGEGLAGAVRAVVDERQQRMTTKPSLVCRTSIFFLAVRGDQGGVEVDDQRIAGQLMR